MTPSPWGRSPPPPLSGMYRYSEYRWSLAASHPRLAANAAGAEPPHCRASSKGCVLPSAPSAPMCRQSSAPRPPPPSTLPQVLHRTSAIQPPGNSVLLKVGCGGEAHLCGAAGGGAAGVTQRGRGRTGTPGQWHRCSRSAALALPDANVPLWRRSARPWVLFGSVGTCGRASLSSLHTGCWVDNAGVKILGL